MRILREPLVHFLLLGAALFAVSIFVGRGTGAGGGGGNDKKIAVTAEKAALLRSGFVLDNSREPTDAELQRLIDNYVREEVLVREARAQGLDRDDSIVRRRLVQKMEFAVAEPAAPADAELEKYLAGHPEAFRTAEGKLPALAEIHGAVLAAWMNEQRKAALDALYQKYRAEYQVTVDMPAAGKAGGGGGR
jgi:hypothetical protein